MGRLYQDRTSGLGGKRDKAFGRVLLPVGAETGTGRASSEDGAEMAVAAANETPWLKIMKLV